MMKPPIGTSPEKTQGWLMGDHGHGHELGERLYIPGDSRIHDLPAHIKILVAVLTIFAIVLTPAQAIWAFIVYFLIIRAVIGMSNLEFRRLLPRMIVEVPFLVFALLMPIIGTAPKIAIGPVLLSEPGLWAAWALIAKATLGVLISVTLAATTQMTEAIAGLRRLRVPDLFVSILTSMIRYLNVVAEESRRMSRARAARGFTGHGPRSWPILAQSLGTLFIRSYERGERVHLAMMSRGYQGHMPELVATQQAATAQWIRALMLPALVGGIGILAVISQWS